MDGAKIVQQMGTRFNKAIVRTLATCREALTTDPQLAAYMLEDAMVGVSRRMLESGAAEKQLDTVRRELIYMTCAYLDACSAHVSFSVQVLSARPTKNCPVKYWMWSEKTWSRNSSALLPSGQY